MVPQLDSYFSGFKNKDVAFLHKDSKSLIEADLLMNLPPQEQVGTRILLLYSVYLLIDGEHSIPKRNLLRFYPPFHV